MQQEVVKDFGAEWSRFDQVDVAESELQEIFRDYFEIFPWDQLPEAAEGFDMGCGTGRWAQFVAPRVGTLHCVEPSDAIDVARGKLAPFDNCRFHRATAEEVPLKDASQDFGYALGVLHHIPDTPAAMEACVRKLEPGAPFLVYLYYAFENRPPWYQLLWRASELVRDKVSDLPSEQKELVTDLLAGGLYWPLARTARLCELLGLDVRDFPLTSYRDRSFYSMRTDSLDRFGTKLEQRFSRDEIGKMMQRAGLVDIEFSDSEPYWCAVGYREAA